MVRLCWKISFLLRCYAKIEKLGYFIVPWRTEYGILIENVDCTQVVFCVSFLTISCPSMRHSNRFQKFVGVYGSPAPPTFKKSHYFAWFIAPARKNVMNHKVCRLRRNAKITQNRTLGVFRKNRRITGYIYLFISSTITIPAWRTVFEVVQILWLYR